MPIEAEERVGAISQGSPMHEHGMNDDEEGESGDDGGEFGEPHERNADQGGDQSRDEPAQDNGN